MPAEQALVGASLADRIAITIFGQGGSNVVPPGPDARGYAGRPWEGGAPSPTLPGAGP